MACPLSADQIDNLKSLIDLCKNDPAILCADELGFFKSYIESLGGGVPPKKANEDKRNKEPNGTDVEPESEDAESAESDVELDYEGVIEPDNDPPEVMGSSEKAVSEEDMEKSNEKKKEAIGFYSEGKYQEAVLHYTEAILLNPRSAILYAKRGQCFLQMKKPNACIRDCTKALEINPDNATGYKFRGRAHRLLGNFLKAAEDLRMACKIDFDEQTDEWLKEVTPNARKIEEHQRKYERKRLEKQLKETKRRIENMKEEQKKKAKKNTEQKEAVIEIEDIVELLNDPELKECLADPEVRAALAEQSRSEDTVPVTFPTDSRLFKVCEEYFGKSKGKVPVGFSRTAVDMLRFVNVLMKSNLFTGPAKAATATDGDHE